MRSTQFSSIKATAMVLAVVGALLVFSPASRAVSPAPDGGYPGFNTAEGTNALLSLTSGVFNTADGAGALAADTTGSSNTAVGTNALRFNTTASSNSAVGTFALYHNTTGIGNVAMGFQALFTSTVIGADQADGANIAIGYQALANTDGTGSNSGGANNGLGQQALFSNTTGYFNNAFGYFALNDNTTGHSNSAFGDFGGAFVTTGSSNAFLGAAAGLGVTTASGVTCLGAAVGGANTSDTTWIANVYGTTTISGTTLPVLVSATGQLGTTASSRRFKKEIKPMDKASEALLSLKPVTFHYKQDAQNVAQFGLIAEEVAAVDPDLVVRDKNGEVYTVRYDAVNAMLLNEFLKEHRRVEEQATMIAEQQKAVKTLTASLKDQAAQIQKVSAELTVLKSKPQLVDNAK